MDVSFIVPLYNCLPLTQAMLASLHATLPDGLTHEILLVDDGSTDGTREWLKTLATPPYRVFLNAQNWGYARSNNRAAAEARGEHLLLLNNDLILTAGWLEAMFETQRGVSRAGVIGNVQRRVAGGAIDHTGIFINARGKPQHDTALPTRQPWKEVVALTGACMLIERKLWQELGGFDDIFVNGCEDVDLCFKARRHGRANAVALNSVIFHHVSASPGRKRRDEENTQRLTLRWKQEIAEAALDAWCHKTAECDLNGALGYADPLLAWDAVRYALGWGKKPPARGIKYILPAMQRELDHWSRTLERSQTE